MKKVDKGWVVISVVITGCLVITALRKRALTLA